MSFLTKINSVLAPKALKLAGSLLQQNQKCICLSPLKRFYMRGLPRSKFQEGNYLTKDKIPAGYSIIYRAPLDTYLFLSKEITTLTSLLMGAVVLLNFAKEKWLFVAPAMDFGVLHTSEGDVVYFLLGFMLISLAARVMVSKIPLRIYKNQAKYIAVFEGQIPLVRTKKHFERGEVAEAPPSRMNPWTAMTYRMKDTNVIMFMDYFKTPSELFDMFKKEIE